MALSKIDVANMLTGTIPVDNSKSGSILQVQSTLLTSTHTQTITQNTDTDVTGLNVTITPSSTSSKILLFGRCVHEMSVNMHESQWFYRRGSTKFNTGVSGGNHSVAMTVTGIGHATDHNSTMDTADMITIDSNHNTTSPITYHIALSHNQGGTLYVNRVLNSTNAEQYERASSEIIAMEIKG